MDQQKSLQAADDQGVDGRVKKIGERFDTKRVVNKLADLMDGVTAQNCTPATVEAAVKCAGAITELLKVEVDVIRMVARAKDRK